MTDLVKALRDYRALCKNDSKVYSPSTVWAHFEAAADEIERLRAEVKRLNTECDDLTDVAYPIAD